MHEQPSLVLPPDIERPPVGTSSSDATRATSPAPGPSPGWSRRNLAVTLVVALIAGMTGGLVAVVVTDDDPMAAPATTAPPLAGTALDIPALVERVTPVVVPIQTEVEGRFGATASGAGTGIVVTADGEILTNAHVVAGATTIRVTLPGEARSREARVIGADTANDLALIAVDGVSDLQAAELGRSESVEVGDDVVAIGNSLALRGGPTVTRGIVSGIDRTVETTTGTMTGLIQTDASISSGNSGGPLVNSLGQVIGINTAVAASNAGTAVENIGFAITIDRAVEVIDRLRDDSTTDRRQGYLGVSVADPTDGSRGALITSVSPGSPAATAGLRDGDLVIEVDTRPIDGAAALGARIRSNDPGVEVTLTVFRGEVELTVEVTLGELHQN
jgi:S1-C subfamily serine protease